MKAWGKLLAAALVILASPLVLMWLFSELTDNRPDKDTVFKQVRKNEQALTACVESGDYRDAERLWTVMEVNAEDDCVDFFCGGVGFGSATAYCGFFYSAEDDLNAVWCAPEGELTADGNGWRWEEPGGDNRYYVEHICGHFYYYEASF